MHNTARSQRAICLLALVLLAALGALPTRAAPSPASSIAPAAATCGVAWQVGASREIGYGSTVLNDVVALAPNNLWAVGWLTTTDSRYQQPLIEHWNGTNWAWVPAPPIEPSASLYAVAATAPNDIWAAGSVQQITSADTLVMHWNGATWSRIPSPNKTVGGSNTLHDIAAVAPNDVWAVGDDGGQPIIIHWNGSVWSLVAYPNLGPDNAWLRGLTAVTANDIWAVGHHVPGSSTTLTMHWNGSSWAVVPSPNHPNGDGQLYAVDAVASNDIWAVGTGFLQPLVLHWNGASWSRADVPQLDPGDNTLYNVVARAAKDIWAVGSNAYNPIALHWDGATWHDASPQSEWTGSSEWLRGVAALSASNVWAVGGGTYGMIARHYAPTLALNDAIVTHTAGGGAAAVSVALSTTAPQTVTVAYATSDDTAHAGVDYVATSGVLKIPPCRRSATFSVPLLDNPSWKPSATVKLTIANPQGAALGTPASKGINIANYAKAPPGRLAYLPSVARPGATAYQGKLVYVGVQDYGAGRTNWDIWVMNADGTERRQLTNGPARDYNPAWAPDGRRIAFVSERDGNPEIYVMNADGSQQTRLTTDAGMDAMPDWAPDGRRIVFVANRNGQQLLYVMNADGSQQIPITNAPRHFDPQDSDPAWSPNGDRIAFASGPAGSSQIYIVGSDGSQLQRLTNQSFGNTEPAWSPDSQQIAFTAQIPGYVNLATIRPDGSQFRLLNESFDTGDSPTWSPDGAWIAFSIVYGNGIWITNLGGGQPTHLAPHVYTEFDPDWQPRS